MSSSAINYKAFCSPYRGGHDVVGFLLYEDEGGWRLAGQHVSSSPTWSEQDLRGFHFERRENPHPDDTFEWVGELAGAQAEERFPPAPPAPVGNGRTES